MRTFWERLKNFVKRLAHALRKPKWRHGRWSVLAFSAFAAVCVLVNVGVESLEKEYGWRKDFSFNGYATTGAETQTALARLEKDVDVYLLYQGDQMDSRILELLNRYAVLSNRIHVQPTDIAKNPGIFNRFKGSVDQALEANAVIVSCEATGRYRMLTYDDFASWEYSIEKGDYEMTGYAYEKRLTEALLYVAEDHIPVVGLLQGHGEFTLEEMETFTTFLDSNNYGSQAVTLMSGESLEGIDLLVIAGPQKDLNEGELEAISAFTQRGGNLLVMRDYTDPMTLPNYFSLLRNYGVQPLAGVVIAAEEDTDSYFGERMFLVPTMCELDMTLPLIAGKLDYLFLVGACAFETPGEPDHALVVATVLKSGPHAYVRALADANISIEKQAGDRTGELSLALFAHRAHATGNVSRMFAIGNSALFMDEYIQQRTFSQEFMLQVLGELLPQKTVSLDIMASAAFHPGLRVGSQAVGIALMVAMPLCTLIAALVVLLPRRNR